jgi:hypothetical protein
MPHPHCRKIQALVCIFQGALFPKIAIQRNRSQRNVCHWLRNQHLTLNFECVNEISFVVVDLPPNTVAVLVIFVLYVTRHSAVSPIIGRTRLISGIIILIFGSRFVVPRLSFVLGGRCFVSSIRRTVTLT